MVESNTWNLTLILLAKPRSAVPTAPMQERLEGAPSLGTQVGGSGLLLLPLLCSISLTWSLELRV